MDPFFIDQIHEKEDRRLPVIVGETSCLIITPTPDGVAPYGRGTFPGYMCVTIESMPKEQFNESEFRDEDKYQVIADYKSWLAGLRIELVEGDDPCGHQNAPLGNHNDPLLDPVPALPSKHKSGSVVDMWLVDTGCGHDLLGRKGYDLKESNFVYADVPLTFGTANGEALATFRYLLSLDEIGYDIAPYILKDSPAVLTVG